MFSRLLIYQDSIVFTIYIYSVIKAKDKKQMENIITKHDLHRQLAKAKI